IRNVLDAVAKRLGFELELTDAQLVRNLILPAREYARNGGKPAGPRIFQRTFSPFRISPERRDFLRAGAAFAAGNLVPARPSLAGVTVGRAKPLPAEALDQQVSPAAERALRGGRKSGAQLEGAKALRAAFAQMA